MLCKSFVLAVVYAWRVDQSTTPKYTKYMPYDAFLLAMSGTLESNGAIQEHEGLTGGPRLICSSLFRPNALSPPPCHFRSFSHGFHAAHPRRQTRPSSLARISSHLPRPSSSHHLYPHLHLHLQLHTPSSCCSGSPFPLPSQSSISLNCPFFHRLFRSPTLLRTPTLDLRSYPWPHLSRFNKYLTTNPALHNQRVDIIGQVQCWDRDTCNYNPGSSQSLEIPPHSLAIY